VKQARRGLLVFMLALICTTFATIWLSRLIPRPTSHTITYLLLIAVILSYSPALAALIARSTLREDIKDLSFRLGGEWNVKAMLIAWLWPVLSGLLVYGLAWTAGFTRFARASAGYPFGTWGPENLIGISVYTLPLALAFVVRLVACLLFSFLGCIQSLGEELGWRGYMLTRLFDARIPLPVLWNGLVWGLWHIPYVLMLTSSCNLPERRSISLFFFVVGSVAGAYLIGYLRLRSGSIYNCSTERSRCSCL
jgi:hypothetical protein